jgi:3-methyladenine DNA glycosylase Tag
VLAVVGVAGAVAAVLLETAVSGHSPLEVALLAGLLLWILKKQEGTDRKIGKIAELVGTDPVSDRISKALSKQGSEAATLIGALKLDVGEGHEDHETRLRALERREA